MLDIAGAYQGFSLTRLELLCGWVKTFP